MRLQDTAANCGPASLSNALQALGVVRTPAECEVLCGTTGTDGTSPKKLLAAIRAIGRAPTVIDERRSEVAALFLHYWLSEGRSAVLCVDDATHWVAAIGIIGTRVLVADPADNELVLSLSRLNLAQRWECSGRYWGVAL